MCSEWRTEVERLKAAYLRMAPLTLLETSLVLATPLGELEGKAGTRSQTCYSFASLLAGFPEMTEAGLIE